MEGQNGNSLSHRATENGVKGKPLYSVETPYGFRLDLDFLKYVDDIEKGNTIKRVPIQRRNKGPRSSTLPRNLNLSGHGYRPSPWGSTGALGPKPRLSDSHYCYGSWAYDHRSSLSPEGFKSQVEMEARIRAFDEQPLGEHIRPNLLRASSLPLTVLLRQGSESTEETGSLRSSRDHLGGRDASCEDVFHSSDIPLGQDFSGTLRRLTEALERVGELEMEVRVIPELKAQICILQEERERLRLGLNPRPAGSQPNSINGSKDSSSSYYGTSDTKRQRHDSHIMFPRNHKIEEDDPNPTHEWRTSTDLDELLTVTSLQAKVAVLEQKLHESSLELQRASAQLKEQQMERRRKDERIDNLTRNPGVWMRAERVVVDQDGDGMVESSTGCGLYGSLNYYKASPSSGLNVPNNGVTVTTNGQQRGQQQNSAVSSMLTSTRQSPPVPMELEEASPQGMDSAVAAHHVRRIKRLLEKQWLCLCGGKEAEEKGKPLEHPDPTVNSLQQEMMGLVHILSSYYDQHGLSDREGAQHEAPKSIMKRDGGARTSKNLHFAGDKEGCEATSNEELAGLGCDVTQSIRDHPERKEGHGHPGEMAAAQQGAVLENRSMEKERDASPGQQMMMGETGPRRTDVGVVLVETRDPEKAAKQESPPREQVESDSGSFTTTGGRETVNGEFMAACQFLEDHMDKMDNPNDDMRRALVVVFQNWFSVSAEEDAVANKVALYLIEVKKATPSLLAFLVNLADDNGNTALHYSLSHCNYSIVSLLLDTGVTEVDLQNNAGYTAVMLASLTAPETPGDMEVVRKLMDLADVNVRSSQGGQTALQLAVRHGRVVMVRLLLSCGADANIQDSQGTTALMSACERSHTHIARLLLERCHCNLTLTDKRGRTALSVALQSSHTDTAALIQAHAKARGL